MVTVRLFAAARAAAGTATTEVSGENVAQVLEGLISAHPGLEAVLPRCSFLVDGLAARSDTPVGPQATLDVLPPFAGG